MLHRRGIRGRADDGDDREEVPADLGHGGGHLAAEDRRVELERAADL